MIKITRKRTIVSLAFLAIVAGTNTATYLVANKSNPETANPISANIDPEKDSQAEILNKLSEATTGTSSMPITDLHAKTQEYIGKTVTVNGVLYESLQDKSVFLSQLGDKPAAIELTFDNFNKDDLILNSTYVVTGILVHEEGQTAKIDVTSAEKI